ANICYYVQAIADINIGGHTEQIVSRSNTICIAQPTSILTPNAFAPSGVNYEFKPILRFGYSVDYQLTIWDRWGQKVFQSNDVLTGWTGRKGYFEYPQGVYTYYIRVKQSNGNEVEKKGTVFLLR
ncbi:MAG TPA: hypothetical protein ENJ45_03875, partial [Phaeodactylibacter sp.]|nr:hypothetical protein [Phaeodactylibacter sp.]